MSDPEQGDKINKITIEKSNFISWAIFYKN